MTGPAKRKGDRAEREAAELASGLTGFAVRRMLGAGRRDDVGDLLGVPDHVVQVVDWADALKALRHKPIAAEEQRANAGAGYAATMVRLRGGEWRVVLTPQQWAAYVSATLPCPTCGPSIDDDDPPPHARPDAWADPVPRVLPDDLDGWRCVCGRADLPDVTHSQARCVGRETLGDNA